MKTQNHIWRILSLTACLYLTIAVHFAKGSVPESQLKALFLYKFIENTQWPSDKANIVVGVLGETELLSDFKKLVQAKNRNITAKQITQDDISKCDVVFLPGSKDSEFNAILKEAQNKSVLIVTEEQRFLKTGACISFVKENDKLGFAFSKASIQQRNLKVSADMLKLGRQV